MVLWAICASACQAGAEFAPDGGENGLPDSTGGNQVPEQAVPSGSGLDNNGTFVDDAPPSVSSYVAKVKNLACGQAPTAEEVAAVTRDPNALAALVDVWMATPSYREKMAVFFGDAFQQADVTANELNLLGSSPSQGWWSDTKAAWLRQSYVRVVQEIVDARRPFTETVTTQRMWVNPWLLSMYLFADGWQSVRNKDPKLAFTVTTRAIDPKSSLDRSSPDYMKFTVAGMKNAVWTNPACATDPIVVNATNDIGRGQQYMPSSLLGFIQNSPSYFVYPKAGSDEHISCKVLFGWPDPLLGAEQSNAWRMVTVRQARPGEEPDKYYDARALREANELVFLRPRVGFMDTFAFQAHWPTNSSNQWRAAMNQALIVALGQEFDGSDQTKPLDLAALDQGHADPKGPCYGCHLTLDPMRQFFVQSWNNAAQPQSTATSLARRGQWAWDGVAQDGNFTADLAQRLASSPRFATGWTQKVCTYLRSSPCVSTDPEFVRIANNFARNKFDFHAMVRELLLSPLVTFAARTATEASLGQSYAVNKQVHLCSLLSQRLSLPDVCGLVPDTSVPSALQPVATVASIVPADKYSRGATSPTQANDPTLPLAAGAENLCKALANVVVDGSNPSYKSSDSEAAIAALVHNLMGIEVSRDATPIGILRGHYATALQQGASKTVALRSTFVVACLSPTTLIGGL